ncbi:MAG: hypothetical protein ACRDRO_05790 [Pseudonocardiaceae bacterium]
MTSVSPLLERSGGLAVERSSNPTRTTVAPALTPESAGVTVHQQRR